MLAELPESSGSSLLNIQVSGPLVDASLPGSDSGTPTLSALGLHHGQLMAEVPMLVWITLAKQGKEQGNA